MNRSERRHRTENKLKKRMKIWGVKKLVEKSERNEDIEITYHFLKTTSVPCSCNMCNNKKYNRRLKISKDEFKRNCEE